MNKRIFFSDNGTLRDLSTTLSRFNTAKEVVNVVAAEDALYIGSRLPFNSVYFNLTDVNTANTIMSVQYWANSGWNNVVETIDETEGFTKSGNLTFVPSKNITWTLSQDTSLVTGLNSIVVYDLYWLKITFSANFLGSEILPEVVTDPSTYESVSLNWVGSLFAEDSDLGSEYPDLVRPSVLSAFKVNKTNWQEQHVRAGELLIDDLIKKSVLDDGSQILVRDDYKQAAVSRCAELIFAAFGDDYIDQRKAAHADYLDRIVKRIHKIDTNADGIENLGERKITTGWLSR